MWAHNIGDDSLYNFFEMMGADAKVASVEEMKALLDKLREEDA